MDFLIQLFNQFNTYSKANPILAGVISLWGAGVATWLLRGVPLKVWGFLKHQGTTTLTMTNSMVGTNFETYNSFMTWLLKSKWMKYSRSISIGGVQSSNYSNEDTDSIVVGIGDGTHFFTYGGWPYWVTRSQSTAGQAGHHIHYQLTITGLGRNRKRVMDMIEDFKYKPAAGKLEIYTCEHGRWSRIASILPRSIQSVMTEGGIKDKIIAQIEKYKGDRDWYHTKGLPYKLTYVLHGPAGTGKTSLIKAIATHLGRSICLMSFSEMSDGKLNRLLAEMPENSLLLIEDFDSSSAVSKRAGVEASDPSEVEGMVKLSEKFSGLTLSGVLNAFDGIVSLDDRLIFLTTNVLDSIDPAMVRPGRVDHVIEIGYLKDSTIREYIGMMYPGRSEPEGVFAPIAGCSLQEKYLEYFDDYDAFVTSIPREEIKAQASLKAA